MSYQRPVGVNGNLDNVEFVGTPEKPVRIVKVAIIRERGLTNDVWKTRTSSNGTEERYLAWDSSQYVGTQLITFNLFEGRTAKSVVPFIKEEKDLPLALCLTAKRILTKDTPTRMEGVAGQNAHNLKVGAIRMGGEVVVGKANSQFHPGLPKFEVHDNFELMPVAEAEVIDLDALMAEFEVEDPTEEVA